MTARNAPCPCGSGRKYKVCCGRPVQAERDEMFMRRRAGLVGAILKMFWSADYGEDGDAAIEDFLDAPLDELDEDEVEALFDPESPGSIPFGEWVVHDHILLNGRSVIDEYLRRRGKRLTAAERAYLLEARDTVTSLYRVDEARPGLGLTLTDAFLGGTVEVAERKASRTLRAGHWIAVRLQPMGGALQLCGAIVVFTADEGPDVAEALEEEYEAWYEAVGNPPDVELEPEAAGQRRREFLKGDGGWFYRTRQEFAPRLPEIRTSDGLEFRPCSAHYDVGDPDAVRAALDAVPSLEGHDAVDEWVWLGGGVRELPGGTLLGSISMKDGRLSLECMALQRLAAGRALLEEACGDLIVHRMDTEEDLAGLLEDRAADRAAGRAVGREVGLTRGPGAPGGPPSEEEQAVVAEYLAAHYRRWIDEPVPALGGLTPRAAAKDPDWEDPLRELLEAIGDAGAGGATFETGWMWEELGLERA